jgi:hypothetical protein
VSANGAVLRSDLTGQIRIKPELSGMPNLSLGLNDRLQLESPLPGTALVSSLSLFVYYYYYVVFVVVVVIMLFLLLLSLFR